MSFTRELPLYTSSTRNVSALRIKALIPNPRGIELHFEDERFAPHQVAADWVNEHGPQAMGYFVIYEDGYQSYLEPAVFEDTYAPIPSPGPSSPPVLVNVDQLLSDLDPATEHQAMRLAEGFLATAKAIGPVGITALCLAVGICAEASKTQT